MEDLTQEKIEDTGLVYCHKKNKIYKVLMENDITNVEQLLNIGNNYKISIYSRTKREFNGFLKIIRYKYLNESTDLSTILEQTPIMIEAGIDRGQYRFENLFDLGLDKDESNRINQEMIKYGKYGYSYRLIDVLNNYYESHIGFVGKQTRVQLNKVKVIMECYDEELKRQNKKVKK